MDIRVAYVDEPPFYGTDGDGRAVGADVELAGVVLAAAGATSVQYERVAFEDLLSGVAAGRWDMNVPIFVTPERARLVSFSVPVWALGDGLLVPQGNPLGLTGYASVRESDARLAVIPGQVQVASARSAGVAPDRLIEFASQPEAVDALRAGEVDAFAATAVGNRAIVASEAGLDAVEIQAEPGTSALVGAFSFARESTALRDAVDRELRRYLGSADHRERMAPFGISDLEIDGALAV